MSGPGRSSVRERLAAGPERGLGCAAELAVRAAKDPDLLRELVDALLDERAVVVVRAANALKKVQESEANALHGFAGTLLRAALGCEVAEARWNLWLVLGRTEMTARQRSSVVDALFEALGSASAFERVAAMQALADVSAADPALAPRVRTVLVRALEDGSAAVRARARRLMRQRLRDQP